MIGVDTLQALLETSELRANLAEGKVEALRMKVATSLEVIENLKDQIVLLEAELADVRELVPVDSDDFLDEIVAERTAPLPLFKYELPPGAPEWSWSADGGWEQNFDFSVKTEE